MVAARKNPQAPPFMDDDMFTAHRISEFIGASYRQKAINLIKKGEIIGAFVPSENSYMATYKNILDYLERRRALLNGGMASQPSLPFERKNRANKSAGAKKTDKKKRP